MVTAGPAKPAQRIALTGVPRSGTTLCCRLLGDADDVVALFEPMKVGDLPATDRSAALDMIAAFFDESRDSLLSSGRAISQQVGGAVPDNPIASRRNEAGKREREASRGEIEVGKELSRDFTLVIKHNAAFTALLPELAQRFQTWAIVRNPLAVLASWHSVSLPVSKGRLPAGERLDPALAEALTAEDDLVGRQLVVLDWFFNRFHSHLPPDRVLPYEDIVASGGTALAEACGVRMQPVELRERNASRLYDPGVASMLARRLLESDGAWRHFYRGEEVEALAKRMAAGGA